jgi:hypothetical protein
VDRGNLCFPIGRSIMLTAYVLFFPKTHAFLFHRQIKRSDFSESARASGLITAFNAVLFTLPFFGGKRKCQHHSELTTSEAFSGHPSC